MANEPGSETSLEWIELYNNGDSAIHLSEFLFVEGGDTMRFRDSLVVPAGAFAALSRKPTSKDGSASFESVWGDKSGIWGDNPDENYLLIEMKFSLRNSSDTVILLSATGDFRELVSWSISPPDGITIERINPFKPAKSDNFGYCRGSGGSTPGRVNSLIPPDNDLGLVIDTLSLRVSPIATEPIVLTARIKNLGLRPAGQSYLLTYFDRDFSDAVSQGESVDSIPFPLIEPESILTVSREYLEPAGRKRLKLQLLDDADTSNNHFQFDFGVGDYYPELIVNEFVANPGDRLDCEWIELLSVVSYPIKLKGFAVGNLTRHYQISGDPIIAPSERLIVCQDSTNFSRYYGNAVCAIVELGSWNRLDNAGDLIVIENDLGAFSDSIRYDGAPTANISWERDEDSTSGSFATRFYPSTDSMGATPCLRNSRRKLPPQNDIGIPNDGLEIVSSVGNLYVELHVKLKNYGYLRSRPSEILVYDVRTTDGVTDTTNLPDRHDVAPIEPNDSLLLTFGYTFASGEHHVICRLQADDNDSNNVASWSFSTGLLTGEIIITEFLANPAGDLECEWVEVRNISGRAIDLQGWRFGDSLRQNQILQQAIVGTGEYLIIAQDSLGFRNYYHPTCNIVQPQSWSSLNNGGDAIILIDKYGTISDSLTYVNVGNDNRSVELNEHDNDSVSRKWYVSTAVNGATPCDSNSVSGETVTDFDVTLVNRVFSPRLGEQLLYRLLCPPTTVLTIEVFDLAGRRHHFVAQSQAFSSGEFSYDGADDNHGTLPIGVYVLKVQTENGSSFSKRIGFAVAGSK